MLERACHRHRIAADDNRQSCEVNSSWAAFPRRWPLWTILNVLPVPCHALTVSLQASRVRRWWVNFVVQQDHYTDDIADEMPRLRHNTTANLNVGEWGTKTANTIPSPPTRRRNMTANISEWGTETANTGTTQRMVWAHRLGTGMFYLTS
jgi:hypothetical protein